MIAPRHNRQGLCVLVVDEHQDTADTFAALLYLNGHCPHVAYDAITALLIAGEQSPDVVLLDLGLSGMDGCDLARHLSGNSRERRPLIVATCGFLDDEHRRRAAEAGINLYWSKPVDPQVILHFINCYGNVYRRQQAM